MDTQWNNHSESNNYNHTCQGLQTSFSLSYICIQNLSFELHQDKGMEDPSPWVPTDRSSKLMWYTLIHNMTSLAYGLAENQNEFSYCRVIWEEGHKKGEVKLFGREVRLGGWRPVKYVHVVNLWKASTAGVDPCAANWQWACYSRALVIDCYCNSVGFMANVILAL